MSDEELLKTLQKYGTDFLNDFTTTLDKESDRGVILICASTIDCFLKDLMEKYLNKNKGRKKEISKLFEYPNPLNSFASKIQMSYCLGLIQKEMYEDFERIRKIRNTFAHGYDYKDFATHEIAIIVFDLVGAKKCWENMRKEKSKTTSETDNKDSKEKGKKTKKVDVRKVSKTVFLTTVSYWLGVLASFIEEKPAVLMDETTQELLFTSLRKMHE